MCTVAQFCIITKSQKTLLCYILLLSTNIGSGRNNFLKSLKILSLQNYKLMLLSKRLGIDCQLIKKGVTSASPRICFKYTKKFILAYTVVNSGQASLSFRIPDLPIFFKPGIYFNDANSNSCIPQIFSAVLRQKTFTLKLSLYILYQLETFITVSS